MQGLRAQQACSTSATGMAHRLGASGVRLAPRTCWRGTSRSGAAVRAGGEQQQAAAAPQQQRTARHAKMATAAAAACAAAALLAAPQPALADLVQVTEMAKPLPKQTIDKTKVWVAFIGGAVTVFGLTVLSENNESWFPAISRANKAMEMSRKRAEEAAAAEAPQAAAVDVEASEVARQQALVEAGMAEARERMRQRQAEEAAAAAAAAAAQGQAAAATPAGGEQQPHQQQQAAVEGEAPAAMSGVVDAQAALRSYKEQQQQQQQSAPRG